MKIIFHAFGVIKPKSCSFHYKIGQTKSIWVVTNHTGLIGSTTNALPGKGYLSKENRVREQDAEFVAARKQHPAVESGVNNLEHRGLDRIRSHGADGFARMASLSVLAANVHRVGLLLQRAERNRIRRQKKARLRVA